MVLHCKSVDSQQMEDQVPATLVWVFQPIKWMALSKCLWGSVTCYGQNLLEWGKEILYCLFILGIFLKKKKKKEKNTFIQICLETLSNQHLPPSTCDLRSLSESSVGKPCFPMRSSSHSEWACLRVKRLWVWVSSLWLLFNLLCLFIRWGARDFMRVGVLSSCEQSLGLRNWWRTTLGDVGVREGPQTFTRCPVHQWIRLL